MKVNHFDSSISFFYFLIWQRQHVSIVEKLWISRVYLIDFPIRKLFPRLNIYVNAFIRLQGWPRVFP